MLLRLTDRRAGVVLLYHELADRGGDPTREIAAAHASTSVERQLRHLRRWYRVVDAREIVDAVRSRRRGSRFPAAVTFDDDLRTHVRVALPLLRRLGLRATFFLSGASLVRPFAFWWERLQHAVDVEDERLATVLPAALTTPLPAVAEQVKRLPAAERDALADALAPPAEWEAERGLPAADADTLAAAMPIGFHTLRHDPLDQLDDALLAEALVSSNDLVAYPHGAVDERVADAARSAGFALGFTVGGGPVRADVDELLVPRFVPTYGDLADFALQLVRRLWAA